jgi:sugar phosphate isomerase/epimerase
MAQLIRKILPMNGIMPRFGLLTDPIEQVPEEIIRLKKLGFDYVEIGFEEPEATPQILAKQRRRILALLSENRMCALGHTAYWVQFGSSHQRARKGWIEEAKDMIRVAGQLKIDLLNFHFYGRLGRVGATEESTATFLENFTDSMRQLSKFAKAKKVSLMLENVPTEKNGIGRLENFSAVMTRVPELQFHLDVGHAFIENRMNGIRSYIDAFADKLVHIHIHDNHGTEDEHLPLGWGKIDFKKVVRWLKELNYCKTITFEVFTSYSDAVRSRERLKKLWSKSRL